MQILELTEPLGVTNPSRDREVRHPPVAQRGGTGVVSMVHDPERPRGMRWPAWTPTQADLASDLPRPLQPDLATSPHLPSDLVPRVADLRNVVPKPACVSGTEWLHPGLSVNGEGHVHNLIGAPCPHPSPLVRRSMAKYGRPGAAGPDWICQGADNTLTELLRQPVHEVSK